MKNNTFKKGDKLTFFPMEVKYIIEEISGNSSVLMRRISDNKVERTSLSMLNMQGPVKSHLQKDIDAARIIRDLEIEKSRKEQLVRSKAEKITKQKAALNAKKQGIVSAKNAPQPSKYKVFDTFIAKGSDGKNHKMIIVDYQFKDNTHYHTVASIFGISKVMNPYTEKDIDNAVTGGWKKGVALKDA